MPRPACAPSWYFDGIPCPYGTRLPGDITLPNGASWFSYLCVFWGYVPFAVSLLSTAEFLYKRGTREAAVVIFNALVVFNNEIIVKNLLDDPRPGSAPNGDKYRGEFVGSCNISCGMPSSHATISVGYLFFLILDACYRTVPSRKEIFGQNLPSAKPKSTEHSRRRRSVDAMRTEVSVWWSFVSATPLTSKDVLTHDEFVAFIAAWIVILAPVPLSRMLLFDHYADQVLAGGFVGLLEAAIFTRVVRVWQFSMNRKLGKRLCWYAARSQPAVHPMLYGRL
jgi:membrane-associated phospholipid phosphatase